MRTYALYVPCYPGEFGWEVINYVPYVNHWASNKKYKEVHISVREGREFLYPMGTHFYPIKLSMAKVMANSGPKIPKNNIQKILERNFMVTKVPPLPSGMRYAKQRKFLRYTASEKYLQKWDQISKKNVGVLIRGRSFGSHKNWNPDNWIKLCYYIRQKGFIPIPIGLKEKMGFTSPVDSIDLRDKTDCGDLIAIFSKVKFVIGQSTGTAHLASLCGTPHAIWGSERIKNRYLQDWNPFQTIVEYFSCGSNFNIELNQAKDLIDRIINRC